MADKSATQNQAETEETKAPASEVAGNPNVEKAKIIMLIIAIAIFSVMYLVSNIDFGKDNKEEANKKSAKTNSLLEKASDVGGNTKAESEEAVHFLEEEWFDEEEFNLSDPVIEEEEEEGDWGQQASLLERSREGDGRDQEIRDGVSIAYPPARPGYSGGRGATLSVQDFDDGFEEDLDDLVIEDDKKDSLARRSTSIVFKAGSSKNTDFLNFGDGRSRNAKKLNITSFPQVEATRLGDTHRIIAQGKTIPVILESSIDTNLPGSVRAIVARDVYSESGKNVLIAKGARVIGSYNAVIVNGQARVNVIWNRVIAENGVDINITSESIDEIGKAGVEGNLHTQWASKIMRAALVTAIPLGVTAALNYLPQSNNQQQQQQPAQVLQQAQQQLPIVVAQQPTGNNINSETAIQQAGAQASQIMQDVVRVKMGDQPYMTLPHGSRINIFVNKDLIFPEEAVGKNIVIM